MTRRSVGSLAAAALAVVSGVVAFATIAHASPILPPADPTANVVAPPALVSAEQADCQAVPIDDSAGCTQALLAEIDYGLATEGLAPMTLPSNWASLSVPEQIFVVVDLERVARGLQPFLGLNFAWDVDAQVGAFDNTDPPAPTGNPWIATEWAGGAGDFHSALEADFVWMYDDGVGSPNIDCGSVGATGCWIHRNNILSEGSCTTCIVGAGFSVVDGVSSMAAVFVEPTNPGALLAFTWAGDVVPFLGRPPPPVTSPPVTSPPVTSPPVTTRPVTPSASPASGGYREVARDGGLFAFGAPFDGSEGGARLDAPVVGMALDPWTGGYWEVASDGGVFAFDAPFYGSEGGQHLDAPVVGIAADPATGGYWEVAADGGIFAFHAPFLGSEGGARLDAPVVGMALDPWTGGYWEVGADGGVFAFHAPYFGSEGGQPLSAPVVGLVADPATAGYWEVAADGGVFAFHAPYLGSEGGQRLSAPVVGMTRDPYTGGYWEVGADGGVFAFDAPYFGSEGGVQLAAPVVGIAP